MPDLRISVGDRSYTVACQAGEELHLQSAAGLLDAEAKTVLKAAPNVSETQLLMMAGLMLADKMAADGGGQGAVADGQISELKEKLLSSEKKVSDLSKAVEEAKTTKALENGSEVELLEKMATELEQLADEMEASAG